MPFLHTTLAAAVQLLLLKEASAAQLAQPQTVVSMQFTHHNVQCS
jgi:hypothetical protein